MPSKLFADLALVLAPWLIFVAQKLLEKGIIEPGLSGFREQIGDLAKRGYKKEKDKEALQNAFLLTIEAAEEDQGVESSVRLQDALKPTNLDDATLGLLAAASVEMNTDDPNRVPQMLLELLQLEDGERSTLSFFLHKLRVNLLGVKEYGDIIRYADGLAERHALEGLFTMVAGAICQTEKGAALRTVPGLMPAKELEEAYLDHVEKRLQGLSLLGRDESEAAMNADFRSIRLAKVYIALNTTDSRHLSAVDRVEEVKDTSTGRVIIGEAGELVKASVLRELAEHRSIVLLGEPGSGKSTFTRHVCLCLARARLNENGQALDMLRAHDVEAWTLASLFPIFLRLSTITESGVLPQDKNAPGEAKHIKDYLAWYLNEEKVNPAHGDLLQHILGLCRKGAAFLVADGLDEIADIEQRRQAAEALTEFAKVAYPRVKVMVTCRSRQYAIGAEETEVSWSLKGFRVIEVADFDKDQIDEFIGKWFDECANRGRITAERARDRITSMTMAIRHRSELRAIATRPLVLSQMAIVHTHDELPDSKVKVYSKCVEQLLWKWPTLRDGRPDTRLSGKSFLNELGVPGVKEVHIEEALDRAVYDAHQNEDSEVPDKYLRDQLTQIFLDANLSRGYEDKAAKRFIQEWLCTRNGLLLPAGDDSWDAPHPSFKEFMAARHLIAHTETIDGEQMSFSFLGPKLVLGNFGRWGEVFQFAVGLAPKDRAINALNRLYPEGRPPKKAEGTKRDLLLYTTECATVIGLVSLKGDTTGRQVLERLQNHLKTSMTKTALSPKVRASAGLALGKLSDPRIDPLNPDTVPIKGGPFRMGTNEQDEAILNEQDATVWRDEKPSHEVTLSEYEIGRYPVTNAEFRAFYDDKGYEQEKIWGMDGWKWRRGESEPDLSVYQQEEVTTEIIKEWLAQRPVELRDRPFFLNDPEWNVGNLPVVGITWFEAEAYCNWLSKITSQKYELPSEAQWERAARGPSSRLWPWGNVWEASKCNNREADASIGRTSPVGIYPDGATEEGVLDMAGNVWEWCADWYDEGEYQRRAGEQVEDPQGPEHGESRVVRGGSWYFDRDGVRCAFRSGVMPDDFDYRLGFRVVLSPG